MVENSLILHSILALKQCCEWRWQGIKDALVNLNQKGGEVSPRKLVIQSAYQYDITSRVSDFQNGEQSCLLKTQGLHLSSSMYNVIFVHCDWNKSSILRIEEFD